MTSPYMNGNGQGPQEPLGAQTPPPNNNPNGPRNPRAGHEFFQWLRQIGLRRGANRWVGGVCSGVAHRLGWDPLLIRIIWFALCFFGGAGVALYGIAWLLLPDERDGSILVEEVTLGHVTPGFVLSIIMVLGGVKGSTATVPFFGVGLIVTIAIIIAAVAVLSSQNTWPHPWNHGEDTNGNYAYNQQGEPRPQANPMNATATSQGSTDPGTTQAQASWNAAPSSAAPGYATPQQPWTTQPLAGMQTPQAPSAPPKYYEVRRPASQTLIGIIYGLLFLTAAAAAALAFLIPDVTFTGWQLFLLWVLTADVIVGLSLIVLGITGRRSAAIGWMVAPLLILSFFATPQATASISHTQMGTMSVMTEKDYSSSDFTTLSDGVGVTMGTIDIDLSDWASSTAADGSQCPTGDLPITSSLSSVTITLPKGCSWTTSDLTTVGATVSGFPNSSAQSSESLNISGTATFSTIDISQE